MSNTKLKWGIIGLGKIANKFAHDIKLCSGSVLYAVASRSMEKAEAFAEKYGASKCFDSYEALAKCNEVDVIYIATPHVFHYENSMLCLANGKHVLCEKPIGMNSVQVEAMLAEAQKRKLFLMEGLWTRFMPSTEKLIELLDNKAIGEVIYAKADFGFIPAKNYEGRVYKKELGGGSLLDIGIYPIYLSLLALGTPTEIKTMTRWAKTEVDSACTILFGYENGTKANLESSFEIVSPTEAYVYGTEGCIKMYGRFHHSANLSVFDKSGLLLETFHLPYKGNGYVHEIEEVEKCISSSSVESNKHPLSMSLQLSQLLDGVREDMGLVY